MFNQQRRINMTSSMYGYMKRSRTANSEKFEGEFILALKVQLEVWYN